MFNWVRLLAAGALALLTATAWGQTRPTGEIAYRGPLQVFILAGQSNMEGQGVADLIGKNSNFGKGTLLSLLKDPAKSGLVARLADADGKWAVRKNVWVSFKTEEHGLLTGALSVGFTGFGDSHHFGPELGFGEVMGDFCPQQVLVIKTAWGGKSLYKDFRPPSSRGAVGPYYTKMLDEIRQTLADLKVHFPDYDGSGYHLAGFVWYQGWNDGISKPAVAEYEANLVNLIKDVRRDLNAPGLPFVVGELTGPWAGDAPNDWGRLRAAQAAAAGRAEFKGSVVFVPTHDFVRKAEDSPHPSQDYHEYGNAETYFLVGDALGKGMKELLGGVAMAPATTRKADALSGSAGMKGAITFGAGNWGHMGVSLSAAPEDYRFGFTLYSAAWPVLGNTMPRFQSGLCGNWIYPLYNDPKPNVYNSMEGGLGWWSNTQYLTLEPKFSMGGTAGDFKYIANSPGWRGTTALAAKKMGIAQLSPWLLVPPDGINLRKGTCGELFGYGYMALPLTEAKDTTDGQPIATGNNCWTLFLNTANFKGPVAFFIPHFWSSLGIENPKMIGQGLDIRPGNDGNSAAMEVGVTPRYLATDSAGVAYSRVVGMQFPVDANGQTVLIHNVTRYSKQALWDQCAAWFAGRDAVSGKFDERGTSVATIKGSFILIHQWDPLNKTHKVDVKGLGRYAVGANVDATTWGLQWKSGVVDDAHDAKRWGDFPEYYRWQNNAWMAITPDEIPPETGLKDATFPFRVRSNPVSYIAPEDADSSWKKPGPSAGPFQVRLSDGSVVTYYWYRFVDQPSLQNADLSEPEKQHLQSVVEKIHSVWTMDKDYMAAPGRGELAGLDPALIVQPPGGMEIGYVPIVTSQKPAQ